MLYQAAEVKHLEAPLAVMEVLEVMVPFLAVLIALDLTFYIPQ
jgi:hypothetical protein